LEYNKLAKIDLHIHSTASDGTLSPEEILTTAQDLGLAAIAITDHDTIEGCKEALQIGIPSSIRFLTGVEISASSPSTFQFSNSLHILGYGVRLDNPALNSTLDRLQGARQNRNPQIIKRLNSLGFGISLDQVKDEMGAKGQLGRPHIARLMVKMGFARSIDDVFDNYLGKGKPAYVDKYRVDCAEAIETIISAGGIPVLAHPFLLQAKNDKELESLITELTAMGLKGIEVYYPLHPKSQTQYYIKLAKHYGLLMTGGTDFHGSLKPNIKMGSGEGDFYVSYELYDKLVNARP